jgi:hypothetical protein
MNKQLHVTFTADVTAADSEKGVIVGKIVPYGVFGNTSLGPVAFQAGAFAKPLRPSSCCSSTTDAAPSAAPRRSSTAPTT